MQNEFVKWYIGVLKKYMVFKGRARCREFWMFALFNFIVSILITIAAQILVNIPVIGAILALLPIIYCIAIFLPSIGIWIRRLHDTNRSGWFLLLLCVPIVGVIILIIFAIQKGTPSDNRYGPNPITNRG